MLTIDLHPYQDKDVDRAIARGSMLIAYEMGLGKTVMALAIIEELMGQDKVSTSFVVCLASLKYQWAQEIANKTDVKTRTLDIRADGEKQTITIPTEDHCIIIEGSPKQRAAQYAKVKQLKPDYVIMGYENVVNDWNYVRKLPRDLIVLDEAAGIKTFRAQRTRKIKRLTSPYRYAMTGTPIENGKPEELFSIMQWVDDTVLGRFDLFDKAYIVRDHFGGVEKYKNLPMLHAKLAQAMCRKTRQDEDVKPYLPDVDTKVIEITMDSKTKKAYDTIAAELLAELVAMGPRMGSFDLYDHYFGDGGDKTEAGRIMAKMQALDMLLAHPDLLITSAQNYQDSQERRAKGEQKKNWPGSAYAYKIWQSGLLDDVLDSPKLAVLTDLVETIMASSPKNKVIVFSQYPEMLEIIQEVLPEWGSVTYHGGMSAGQKAASKAKFGNDPDCRIFLSSHAGAVGTDLNMANYLINYDGAWSAGKQDQINGRHVRASSAFSKVYLIDLIMKGTTAVLKHARVNLKRNVGSAIMDNRGADDKGRVENDIPTLREFLTEAAA